MVMGNVRKAKTLMTFFIVAPAGLPSIPSCILHCRKAINFEELAKTNNDVVQDV